MVAVPTDVGEEGARWSTVLAAAGGPGGVGEHGHLLQCVGACEQTTGEQDVGLFGRLPRDEKDRLTLDVYRRHKIS